MEGSDRGKEGKEYVPARRIDRKFRVAREIDGTRGKGNVTLVLSGTRSLFVDGPRVTLLTLKARCK